MKFELYGFWKYDLFPYVLGGKVTKLKENIIETENYGPGYRFKVIKLMPLVEGLELKEKLNALENDYDLAQEKLKSEYKTKLKAIFPEALQNH